ncbi:hemerythrin family protein [Azospirillum rugosum]|uniref:Hemerythrin n=1 Tax=Azospirillum rugosum TaxID=416170 RepID=A0ABS4SQF1_9PROT|nr:hemerythrin family protein [Azospirillum rugosum]MBP2294781.1 hemerythrin [Azospirillum rugosum]MDQ0528297.1 hemerythrin [Azospirillum rugosum]
MTHAVSGYTLQATGSDAIDAEHGAIMDILESLTRGGPVDTAGLVALRTELAHHFDTESAEMAVLPPDRREQHEHAHRSFLATVDSLAETARNGGTVSGDEVNRLMLWFIVHSNTADTELVETARRAAEPPPMIDMADWLASLDDPDLRDA